MAKHPSVVVVHCTFLAGLQKEPCLQSNNINTNLLQKLIESSKYSLAKREGLQLAQVIYFLLNKHTNLVHSYKEGKIIESNANQTNA